VADLSKILLAIEPRAKPSIIAGFANSFLDCINRADLETPLRQAHFLAQTAHESAGFKTTVEFASGRAYEGRRDLGNVEAGDGPLYKGRGMIQLTGRANYRNYGRALSRDLEVRPAQVAEFPLAALVSAEYWRERKINVDADRDNIEGVTRRVNGGLNGLASRKTYLARAKHALIDAKGALKARAIEESRKASTKAKAAVGSLASGVATAGAAPAVPDHLPAWALVAVFVALAGVAVALFLAIREHRAVAETLNVAAKEA
jgi:putative chitinase